MEYQTEREMKRVYKEGDSVARKSQDNFGLEDKKDHSVLPWLNGSPKFSKFTAESSYHNIVIIHVSLLPLFLGVVRRPIPLDELKRLGIPPPPEGNYMSRYEVPSPPRREKGPLHRVEGFDRDHKSSEETSHRRGSEDRELCRDRYSSEDEDYYNTKRSSKDWRSVKNLDDYFNEDRYQVSVDDVPYSRKRSSTDYESRSRKRSKIMSEERERHNNRRQEDSRQRRSRDAERHDKYDR